MLAGPEAEAKLIFFFAVLFFFFILALEAGVRLRRRNLAADYNLQGSCSQLKIQLVWIKDRLFI
jgi:hypothetical protein